MIDKALFLVYNIIVVMSEDITGYMQTYRSGHNGADSKSVCGQPHVGSNPTVSATSEQTLYRLLRRLFMPAAKRCHPPAPLRLRSNPDRCAGFRFGAALRAAFSFYSKVHRAHSAAPRFRTRPAVAGLRFGAALWTVVFRFCPKYRFCPSFARGSTLILLLPLSKLQPLRWGVIWYRRFVALLLGTWRYRV